MEKRPGSGATIALAVGLVAVLLGMAEVASRYVAQTWINRDARFYTNVNVTLTESLSVDQGEFCASWYEGRLGWNRNLDEAWSNVALGRNGEHLPKHTMLMPVLSTPFFWAFGLHGTLIFNLLFFALAGAAGFAVARRHASMPAAAFAGLALMFGTTIREYAYDYHVDVLILALFLCGLACIHAKQGGWAGLLIGMTVVLRPTALLWLPSLAIIALSVGDRRSLGRALIFGALPLALYALSNQFLFGRPWWTGYNRVLIVLDGQPAIADHNDAFSVPFAEGFEQLWRGPFAIPQRLTLMLASIPGLVCMARKRPLYAIGAVLGAVLSIVLFAKYRWYHDRFLWPSCALLLPALAMTFDRIGRALSRWPGWRAPTVAACAAIAIAVAHTISAGPPLSERPDGAIAILIVRMGALAALAIGLTRAAERTGAGVLAILAPIGLVLMPGVREAVLDRGTDLFFAAAVCLAVGSRHWISALAWSVFAGVVVFTNEAVSEPGALALALSRPVIGLAVVSLIALYPMRRSVYLLLPILLLASSHVMALGDRSMPLFALALMCLPIPCAVVAIADPMVQVWRRTDLRRRAIAIGSILAALFVTGLVQRIGEPPLRFASYRGVRTAHVTLGDVPCDFLAWEHLNWECATFDQGVHGETGLSTDEPLHVDGEERDWFLITTSRGRPRTVRWDDVPAAATFRLLYARPDELGGGGRLRVRINGEDLETIEIPRAGPALGNTWDTERYAGRRVSVELSLDRGAALVDGGFAP